jgi:RNA polymerase sigma factor FliA
MLDTQSELGTVAVPLDPAERERLLMENLPEVKYVARRIHDRLPAHVQLDDLIHAGVIGLLDAIDKFDPAKNTQLKTYARFRIRGAILDSLRDLDWSPRSLRKQARRVEEAHRELHLELGRTPSEAELASWLGMELQEFQNLLNELRGLDLGSLQNQSNDEFGEERVAYQPVSTEEDPFFLCQQSEMRAILADAIDVLDERERHVVALYYVEELTMKEVGAVLGIGESRVSQIHSAAMIRLRARIHERMTARPENEAPRSGNRRLRR